MSDKVDILFIIEPPSPWLIRAGMKCLDDWNQIRLAFPPLRRVSAYVKYAPDINIEYLLKLILNDVQTGLQNIIRLASARYM